MSLWVSFYFSIDNWVMITVDTGTQSLCWYHAVPHRDCSDHPHTGHGGVLSLLFVRVNTTETHRPDLTH